MAVLIGTGGFAHAMSGRLAMWPVMAGAMVANMLVGGRSG